MNILQICPGSYKLGRGGISEHVINISERLAKNHNVTVFATNPQGNLPIREIINNVNIERFRRYAPSGAYFFSPEMILRLRSLNCDIVHGHGYSAFPMHYSTLVKYNKLIVTTHYHGAGHTLLRDSLLKLFKPIGRFTLNKANKIIAVSNYEKTLLARDFKINTNKIVVIPNGLDLAEFSGMKKSQKGYKKILFVGRLEYYKGVHFLIDVLRNLNNDISMEIVGRGPLKDWLIKRAERLKIRDRVFFYENLSRRELIQKYFDADLFILLSMFEAYSLVVAEALSAGTKCVVTNTSALSEWVDNKNCFCVDLPVDINYLSELIKDIIYDEIDKRNFAIKPEKKIFDWDEVVLEIERIYVKP